MKHAPSHLILGGVFTLLAVLGTWLMMGQATVVLMLGLIITYTIWAIRGAVPPGSTPRLLPIYIAGLVVMGLHVGEEFLTGFQHQFPALFGYDWSDTQFLIFNALWMAIFVLAAFGVSRCVQISYLVVWFFALVGGLGNGIGHLLLSLAQGRYFPGTLTAPLCLLVGVLLIQRLAGTRA